MAAQQAEKPVVARLREISTKLRNRDDVMTEIEMGHLASELLRMALRIEGLAAEMVEI